MDHMPEVMTLRETAAILRVHPSTVKRWIACGELVSMKLGPHTQSPLRVRAADLDDFLTRHRHLVVPTIGYKRPTDVEGVA